MHPVSRATVLGDGNRAKKGHRARSRPGMRPLPAGDPAPVPDPARRRGLGGSAMRGLPFPISAPADLPRGPCREDP